MRCFNIQKQRSEPPKKSWKQKPTSCPPRPKKNTLPPTMGLFQPYQPSLTLDHGWRAVAPPWRNQSQRPTLQINQLQGVASVVKTCSCIQVVQFGTMPHQQGFLTTAHLLNAVESYIFCICNKTRRLYLGAPTCECLLSQWYPS